MLLGLVWYRLSARLSSSSCKLTCRNITREEVITISCSWMSEDKIPYNFTNV